MPENSPIDPCESSPQTRHCELATAAAEKAVKKTFAILGVDIERPEQVSDFQESLRFGDKLRKAADRGIVVFIAAMVTALLAALWVGIKSKVAGP
jgi:hypothetical protein